MAFSGDDSTCPICGEINNCASVQGREIEKCWCMQKVFTPDLFKQIPLESRGKACVCFKCVGGQKEEGGD